MSSERWITRAHVVDASHLRGFARGATDDFAGQKLRVALKQYTPRSNASPSKGDVTIIMSGGLVSSKESFEPFFDALLAHSEQIGSFRIRSVWCPDPWNTNESYWLNKDHVGDDPDWRDHARDIHHIVNVFQQEMPPPIVGMGESLGASYFVQLSTWHPRLFAGIILMEPGMGPGFPARGYAWGEYEVNWPVKAKYFPGNLISKRKDRWRTREEAVKHLSKAPYYIQMDEAVRKLALHHDLREVGDGTETYVTLATPKFVEAQMWVRPQPPLSGLPAIPHHERVNKYSHQLPGFYRPEGPLNYEALRHVACPTLFVWGEKSFMSNMPDFRATLARTTGVAEDGGGGEANGQLTVRVVKGGDHNVTLQLPRETAEALGPWVANISGAWVKDYETRRTGRPFEQTLSKEWMERVNATEHLPAAKLPKL